jgi:DNA repair ATPase RecN
MIGRTEREIVMYPELDHFNKMKKEYDKNIEQAHKNWTHLHKQKERASKEYEELLNEYGVRNSKVTMEYLTEAKNSYLESLEKERNALEHLDSLKESSEDRLSEYLKNVYYSRDRELTASQISMEKKIDQLERLKAEYLMMVQQIQEIHAYRVSVEKETSDAVKSMQGAYVPKEIMPLYPDLARLEIPLQDIQFVFQKGELPEHLNKYFRFQDSVAPSYGQKKDHNPLGKGLWQKKPNA